MPSPYFTQREDRWRAFLASSALPARLPLPGSTSVRSHSSSDTRQLSWTHEQGLCQPGAGFSRRCSAWPPRLAPCPLLRAARSQATSGRSEPPRSPWAGSEQQRRLPPPAAARRCSRHGVQQPLGGAVFGPQPG